jgi:hypothetical protein
VNKFQNRHKARRHLQVARGESSREAYLMRRMARETATDEEKREFAAIGSKRT